MTALTMGGFPARHSYDRNVFLVLVGLVWIGILTGFGTSSYRHLTEFGLDYPWIVHVHAVTFVSWLLLFTVQTVLIRTDRVSLHRRLGIYGIILAAAMMVIGPATALTIHAMRFATDGATPEFLAVQLTDMLAFGTLTGAGLLLRRNASAHKRLVLLGLFYLSDAGFSRFINPFVAQPLGEGFWGDMAALYFGSTFLMILLGVYDLVTRRRLHIAYVIGMIWAFTLEVTARSLVYNETWSEIALRLIGQ
ncbi:MAG TPA: hypothetical protein PLN33_01230 [Hyphomonadaceae bacterium]|jgi:hypothetical protein|nr:hypothetical protein [Hyphomonadaceae bacterium]HPN05470.1 hypothetical protein [Hyphomonadaceae bacterium]